MLADEVDYVVGVDTHRDEHVLAVVAAPAGAVVAQRAVRCECARLRAGAALRGRVRGRHARLGDRGRGPLRRRPCPLSERPRRDGARGRPHRRERAAAARQGRPTRRDPRRPRGARQRDARRCREPGSAARRCGCCCVARRSAVDVRREALVQLRSVIVTAPDRLRERAARAAGRAAARPLQPASPLERQPRRTSSPCGSSCAHSHDGSKRRPPRPPSSKREILAHVRALAPALLDEPGVGPIVAAQLIVAWSHRRPRPLRSRLRTTRRRRPDPRLSRPDRPSPAQPRRRPPAQPGAAHGDPPPPPARPRHPRLHRPPHRRRQINPRRRPTAQALPRPPPLPATAEPGAADGLTSHRSIIPAH